VQGPIILKNEFLMSNMIVTCGYRDMMIEYNFSIFQSVRIILRIVLRTLWKDTCENYSFLFGVLFGVETLATSCLLISHVF